MLTRSKSFAVLLLLCLLVFGLGPTVLSQEDYLAEITDSQGVAHLKPVQGRRWSHAAIDIKVLPGDWLKTGEECFAFGAEVTKEQYYPIGFPMEVLTRANIHELVPDIVPSSVRESFRLNTRDPYSYQQYRKVTLQLGRLGLDEEALTDFNHTYFRILRGHSDYQKAVNELLYFSNQQWPAMAQYFTVDND